MTTHTVFMEQQSIHVLINHSFHTIIEREKVYQLSIVLGQLVRFTSMSDASNDCELPNIRKFLLSDEPTIRKH